MLSFLRFIRGYYLITLSGYSPERFFNLCRINNVVLWEIIPCEEYYTCKIRHGDYAKIGPFLEKTKVCAKIQSEYGLPYILHRNKKRKVFFGGIIMSFLFLYGMSFYIWTFSFEGNHKISSEILLRFVNSLGVDHGTYKDSIDIQMIEEEIREYFDGISWVSVRINGTELMVSIKENYMVEYNEDLQEGTLDDLAAGISGTVVGMVTRKGVPLVKIGDKVQPGDILVEGRVPIFDNDGNIISYDYVDADADITIRTEYPIHRTISRYYRHKNYTGNEISIPYIRLGQHFLSFGYYKSQYSLYDVMVKENTNEVLEEFSIPIFWGTRRYCEYVEIEDLYGDEESVVLLKKFLEQTMKELEEKGVQIIENNVKIETNSQYLKLTGVLVIDILQNEK